MNADKIFSLQDGEQYLTFSVRKMPPAQLERWLLRANALLMQDAAMPEDGYLSACRTLARKASAMPLSSRNCTRA